MLSRKCFDSGKLYLLALFLNFRDCHVNFRMDQRRNRQGRIPRPSSQNTFSIFSLPCRFRTLYQPEVSADKPEFDLENCLLSAIIFAEITGNIKDAVSLTAEWRDI